MLTILERNIYHDFEFWTERSEIKVTHYWLFELKYHNDTISSIDSEEPIGWWYKTIKELKKNNKWKKICNDVLDYQETLIWISKLPRNFFI